MKKLTKTMLGLGMTLMGSAALAGPSCALSNLDAWSSNNNPAGLIDVTAGAAMGGTACGMEVETAAQPGGQSTKHFVQDSSPVNEARYRGALCFDPNSINLNTGGANRRVKFHNVQCSTAGADCANTDILQFKLENDATDGLRLDMFVRDTNAGNAANKNRNFIPIPDAPTRIEYDLDLSAGTFKLWLNATSEGDTPALDLSGLGTALWLVDRARLGSQDRSGNVPAGQFFYIDEFESRRQTFIGGTCGP